jgi:hypothetical protein
MGIFIGYVLKSALVHILEAREKIYIRQPCFFKRGVKFLVNIGKRVMISQAISEQGEDEHSHRYVRGP